MLCQSLPYSKVTQLYFVVVQSLTCVQLLVTPQTVAHQAPLSFIISQSLLKFTSIELMMPSNHLILCCPLLLPPSVFPSVQPSLWSSSILTALYYKPGPVGGAWDTVRILTIERGKEDLEATVVSCKGSVGMGYWWCPTGKEHPVHTWGEGRFLERRISAY